MDKQEQQQQLKTSISNENQEVLHDYNGEVRGPVHVSDEGASEIAGIGDTESSEDAVGPPSEENEKFAYRDYASEPLQFPFSGRVSPNTSLRVQKLPMKLNAMLTNPHYAHIISWLPHGRAWKIHDAHAFVDEVIPNFFEYTNYNSFIRLVNAWGFRRVLKGTDRGSYYHEVS